MGLRVVVADDSYLVREAITHVLADAPEIELARCASTATAYGGDRGRGAGRRGHRHPHAAAGDDEGIRVAAELRDTHPEIGVVVLSQYLEPRYALELLGRGSDGRAYLLKERVHDAAS